MINPNNCKWCVFAVFNFIRIVLNGVLITDKYKYTPIYECNK